MEKKKKYFNYKLKKISFIIFIHQITWNRLWIIWIFQKKIVLKDRWGMRNESETHNKRIR